MQALFEPATQAASCGWADRLRATLRPSTVLASTQIRVLVEGVLASTTTAPLDDHQSTIGPKHQKGTMAMNLRSRLLSQGALGCLHSLLPTSVKIRVLV